MREEATAKKLKAVRFGASNPRHIVVVSDIHCGCQMGLMPPDGATIEGGGLVTPSSFQKYIYDIWRYFWDKWVPDITEGEPYDVVINGECIDGVHHKSTTQWSQNLSDQTAAAVRLLRPIVERCKGRVFLIRGTEAHSGKSGCEDERCGRELAKYGNIAKTKDGFYSRYDLWKNLGGGLVHFTHHIGATGSAAYESTAPHKEITEAFIEAGRWDQRPPDVVVRSHRHRHIIDLMATTRGNAFAVVTPGWQGKTPFTHKIAGGRSTQPQFGGIVLTWATKEKLIYERHYVRRLERDEPE